jgi:hypothetical protein
LEAVLLTVKFVDDQALPLLPLDPPMSILRLSQEPIEDGKANSTEGLTAEPGADMVTLAFALEGQATQLVAFVARQLALTLLAYINTALPTDNGYADDG